jgi:filamentous hemagglutinin family protein
MHRAPFPEKGKRLKPGRIISASGLSALLLFGQTAVLLGNPTGGQVAAGSATIDSSGKTLTITQASHTAIINWQSFSIAGGELTKFVQPSVTSAALNRVMSGNPSAIYGTLSANGQIYLINPAGILVGPGGVVNTAGFIASTRDIADQDFLSGNLHFTGTSDGGVQNLGTINAFGGSVYLIGNTVDNQGTVNAPRGTAGLAAADDVLVTQTGAQNLFVEPNANSSSTRSTLTGVHNSGKIAATSAELKAANGNMYALAINNSGTIVATTVKHQGGHVFLTSDSGTIVNSGTIDASATAAGGKGGSVTLKSTSGKTVNTASGKILATGGSGGTGGQIETSGESLQIDGTVNAGKGGAWLLDPTDVTIDNNNNGGNDVNAGTLEAALNNGTSETVQAVGGNTDSGNIELNTPFAWTSTATLQLTATGDIGLNDTLSAPTGTLSLSAAGNITDTASLAVGSFILQNGTWNQVTANLPAFTASLDFELQNTSSFLRATGGDGSTGNPYQIADVYGLQGVGSPSFVYMGTSFNLVNNIDATGTATWNSSAGFEPWGVMSNDTGGADDYNGVFNGQGFVINGLTINQPSQAFVGLVGVSDNMVENVGLINANITGGFDTGGLAGLSRGTISNSYTTGSVTGSYNTGGLVGESVGTIETSYSGANVTGSSGNPSVGGLVGENENIISNVYSTGTVNSNGSNDVGGLVGYNADPGTISNAYSSGLVESGSNSSNVGGFVGSNDTANGATISASFWDTSTSGTSTGVGSGSSTGVTGYSTSTLMMESTYSGAQWNIGTDPTSNTWVIFDGQTRPLLAMEYSTTINNAHQLQLIGLNSTTLNANYIVANNIDATGTTNSSDVWGTSVFSGAGFVPIGISSAPFNATFDGQKNTIDGLYINTSTVSNVGLFGYTLNSATLENVALTNVQVTGSSPVGGLVGLNYGAIINTSVSGTVTGSGNVGGLVGGNGGSIDSSYSTAAVNGNQYVGGLVGTNFATISNAYSTGNVTGDPGNSEDVGGLVGYNYVVSGSNTITNTYSTSAVSGTSTVGGLLGYNSSGTTVINSFWDNQTAGVSQGVGSDTSSVTPGVNSATTSDLMSESYINSIATSTPMWDFINVWTTNNDTTLPQLRDNVSQGGNTQGGGDTLSGIAYTNNGSTADAANVVIDLIYNGSVIGMDDTNGSGQFTFTITPADLTGGILLTDTSSNGGNTFYQANTPGSSITGVNIWAGTLRIGADVASNAALGTTGGSLGNYTVSGTTLTTNAGVGVNILSAYTLDGSISAGTGGFTTGPNAALTGSQPVTITAGAMALNGSINDTGAVTIDSGGPVIASGPVTVGGFILENGTWTQIVGQNGLTSLPTFTDSGNFELQNSTTFERFAGGNGSSGNPYQIADVYGLQGLASPSETLLTANAELINNIDATGTSGWNNSAGFVPIGSYLGNSGGPSTYSGTFNGQNHVINGLTINLPGSDYAGLFGDTTGGAGSLIENVGLTNVNVTGGYYVGALVGVDNATITNAYSSGSVTGTTYVGGLFGNAYATISEVSSSATVNATGGSDIGGISGLLQGGEISDSYSNGMINAGSGSYDIGGLVGGNGGTIHNTYSSAVISATGGTEVGGLIGGNGGTVNNSFWDTSTAGSGVVSGVGSDSTPNTTTGVTAATTAQLQTQSFILANSPATPTWNFTPGTGIWGIDGVTGVMVNGVLTAVPVNGGLPYLQAQTPTSIELTADNQTIAYGGSINTGSSEYVVTPGSATLSSYVTGPVTLTVPGSNVNAGFYPGTIGFSVTPNVGVTVEQGLGDETITTTNLTVVTETGVTADNKVYDGTLADTLDLSNYMLSGVMQGDMITIDPTGYTAAFTSKNVGTAIPVTVSGLTLSGTDAGNYTLTQPTGLTANITAATLTITGAVASDKNYDATTAATLSSAGTLSGVFSGDIVTVDSSGAMANFNTKDAGINKSVTVTGYVLSGTDADNYMLTQPIGLTATIHPSNLTVTGVAADDKAFDGTTTATLDLAGAILHGVYNGDSVGVDPTGYTANFSSASVNTSVPVAVTNLGLDGMDASDYTLTQPTGLTANITTASAPPPPTPTPTPTPPIAVTDPTIVNLPAPANLVVNPPPLPSFANTPTLAGLLPVSYSGGLNQVGGGGGQLASASGNGGDIGSGDAAQINGGGVNNVSNPAAAGALNQALGPEVRNSLADALQDIGDWTQIDTNVTGPSSDGTDGGDQETILTGGDVVQIEDKKVKSIPLSKAPKQLQNALGNGVLNGLPSGPGTGH